MQYLESECVQAIRSDTVCGSLLAINRDLEPTDLLTRRKSTIDTSLRYRDRAMGK